MTQVDHVHHFSFLGLHHLARTIADLRRRGNPHRNPPPENPPNPPPPNPAKPPAVKTAKAGLAPKGTGSRKLPMIEAAESAGTRSLECARGGGATEVLPVRAKTTTVKG